MCTGRSTSSARSSTCSCPPDETLTPPSDSLKQAIGATSVRLVEVTTNRAPVYLAVLEALLPAAWHRTDQYANNRVGCDHGRLKARLRPMRGLKQDRSARVVIAGHAFMQNFRRAHYELAIEEPATLRLAVAFDELALAI
jgi:transposase-like protein